MKYLLLSIALLLPSTGAAQNPVVDGLMKAARMRQQIEAARALNQTAATLEIERERVRAEKERLQAETDLLREQTRLLREQNRSAQTQLDANEAVARAIQRVATRHADMDRYRDRMAAIATVLESGDPADILLAFEIYVEGLYLLAKNNIVGDKAADRVPATSSGADSSIAPVQEQ